MGTERIMEELKIESQNDECMYRLLQELYGIQRANNGRWKEKYNDAIKTCAKEVNTDD